MKRQLLPKKPASPKKPKSKRQPELLLNKLHKKLQLIWPLPNPKLINRKPWLLREKLKRLKELLRLLKELLLSKNVISKKTLGKRN